MAAWLDKPAVDAVDLRQIPPGSLDEVLEEESRFWREQLCWDFTASAGLIKRFVDMQSLTGTALVHGARVIGYTYTVVEEEKGLVGDLYILREFASPALEDQLLNATIESLARIGGIRRIESQIILMSGVRPAPLARAKNLRMHERCFMVRPLADWRFSGGSAGPLIDIERWSDRYQEEAAALITEAYGGHVDGLINDQYRSLSGARRFLQNIVHYPGCGSFQQPASWLAWRKETGRLCALSLASLVAHDTGHITQICVAPSSRGEGIGREILSHSLDSLRADGCRQVSLTVTATNRKAIAMYETMGFTVRRRFTAMVWDDLRPPRRYFL